MVNNIPCSPRTGGQLNLCYCQEPCQPNVSHPWLIWLTAFSAISGLPGQQYSLQPQNRWSTQSLLLPGTLSTKCQPSLADLVDHFFSHFWASWSTISSAAPEQVVNSISAAARNQPNVSQVIPFILPVGHFYLTIIIVFPCTFHGSLYTTLSLFPPCNFIKILNICLNSAIMFELI